MTTYTATVPAAAVHAAASLVPFAASGREASMTPTISGVAVSVAGAEFRAVSTDRYMVGEYVTELDRDTDALPLVIIPTAALQAFAKAAVRTGVVTLTHDDATNAVTIDYHTGATRTDAIRGNFPPVSRLFSDDPQELHGAPRLNPVFLAKLAKVKDPATGKSDATPWEFRRAGEGDMHPVQMSASWAGHRFRALLQPNKNLR